MKKKTRTILTQRQMKRFSYVLLIVVHMELIIRGL